MPFYTRPGGNPFGRPTRTPRKGNPFLTSLLGPDFRIPPFKDPFAPPTPDDTVNAPFAPPTPPPDVDVRRRRQLPPPPTFPTLDSPLSQEFFSRNPGAALFAVFRDLLSGPPTPLSRFLLSRADDLQNTYASVVPLDPGLQFIDFLKKGASVPTLLRRIPAPIRDEESGIIGPDFETVKEHEIRENVVQKNIEDLQAVLPQLRARVEERTRPRGEQRQAERLLNAALEQLAQAQALLAALKPREVLREGIEIGPFQPQEEFRRLAPSQRGETPSRFAPRAIYRF